MNRKKVHTACTTAAVIFTVLCVLGIIHTWWIAAIIYAFAMIFLILAFATSKEAKRAMTEEDKPKRVSPIEYVNVDELSWTECYMIALRKEIEDNAQM
jgi:1,4-dihydroxy-2-naphthoate octaprenyltransferase